ncbi:Aste57867_21168 [Aphanomyces stellatus]|uniref:Aste57867_21168 protein n=1 Tax=Aphanomyces stellatus TaxID=120398 RepID=A0A485LI93_9STRA|nr:hypothetical protein As57867_021100 [Aphanomyces stellatus]VFT97842.1 Aste57867_21168 [Aphanomyces stellatus]
MEIGAVKQLLGLFFKQLPDEIALEEGETVDAALLRLRTLMQRMCRTNPTFWNLALVGRMKELLQEHMSTCIEDMVEGAMKDDPTWLVQSAAPADDDSDPLAAVVEDMTAKHPVALLKVQQQLADKVAMEVRQILDHLEKHAKSSSDIQHLFLQSAQGLQNDAPPKPERHQSMRNDAQVFSLDNLGDDEWGNDSSMHDAEDPNLSVDAIVDRLTQSPSNTSRVDALYQLQQIPLDHVVRSEFLPAVCKALIPLFNHVEHAQVALGFYWKLFHATDDISTQCALYVDLLTTLFALPHAALALRKHAATPTSPAQKPLLSLFRMLHSFLHRLPTEWIYISNDLRAHVMLVTCQLFGEYDDAIDHADSNGGVFAPHCVLAWLDPQSTWFTTWHRLSPLKTQWQLMVLDSGLLTRLVSRLVFSFEPMDTWRRLDNNHITPAGMSRRRSAKTQQAQSSPAQQTVQVHLGGLMQRGLIQTVFMLLDMLPHGTIQRAFPLQARNPFKSPLKQRAVTKLTHAIQPDDSVNHLLHRRVPELAIPRTSSTPPETAALVPVSYDYLCLHLALTCILEAWTIDQWETSEPTVHESCWIQPLRTLLAAQSNDAICMTLLDILPDLIAHLATPSPKPPRETLSYKFPYVTASGHSLFAPESKSVLMYYATHVILRGNNAARRASALARDAVPLILKILLAKRPPSPPLGARIRLLVQQPWVSIELVHEIAKACTSPLWYYSLKSNGTLTVLRPFLASLPVTDEGRLTCLLHLCATSLGLLDYGELLLQHLPLESLWTREPMSRRPMRLICHLANLPAVCAAWVQSPALQSTWRHAVDQVNADVQGLEAVYGPFHECPYALRAPVQDVWDFVRFCGTQYATSALATPSVAVQGTSDVDDYITARILHQLSSTLVGSQYVHDALSALLPPCSCDTTPCILDPTTWLYHAVRESAAVVGGSEENPHPTPAMELPTTLSPLQPYVPSAAALKSLHQHVQSVTAAIDAATNYLDFHCVADAFWNVVECLEKDTPATTPELTAWMGDILWLVVCSGKSRLDLAAALPADSPPSSLPSSTNSDHALQWANTWMKLYARRLQNIHDPVACSTLFRGLVHDFGVESCDPFVWTCLMMFVHRKTQAEVTLFFQTLRRCSASLVLWPARAATVFLDANKPLLRVAAAVEMILHTEFPHISTALDRQGCPLLSVLLRWQHQCFWNYLNWTEIMTFVTLVAIHGVEFQTYLFVVVLRQLDLDGTLRLLPMDDMLRHQLPRLRWSAHRPLLERLHKSYFHLVKETLATDEATTPSRQ